MSPAAEPVLTVRDLHVRFDTEAGSLHAVRGLDLDLVPGRTLALVGESGSGKTATALAIMGLLPDHARAEGSVRYRGDELLGLSDAAMSAHRGADLAMVFQDPLSSLTPVLTVGEQIVEALRCHARMPRRAARRRAVELLDLVGVPDPRARYGAFPHELSGGLRQRVLIAIAVANSPRVLIADEPTTALDAIVQAQVLDVLAAAQRETGAALLLVTHDLGAVAAAADDVLVAYAGRAVEHAGVDDLFAGPRMPYTLGLLGAVPRVDRAGEAPLVPVEGAPPDPFVEPAGCPFLPRCPLAVAACADGEPPLAPVPDPAADPGHAAACRRAADLRPDLRAADVFPVPRPAARPGPRRPPDGRPERPEVLRVRGLRAEFPGPRTGPFGRRAEAVTAVDGIDLDLAEGECLALVGESGCGKTTTLLEIMDLDPRVRGEVVVRGTPVSSLRSAAETRRLRRRIQLVFQDATDALDPRFTVAEAIAEPLRAAGRAPAEAGARVRELLDTVGLPPEILDRFPAHLSTGQRQRVGIARALALDPSILVLDEPVSALDVSIRAGVVDLLARLRADLGLSYLFVAHDLAVVRHVADRVAVMHRGRIVETGPVDEVFDRPRHPYTRALLSAVPVPDPRVERRRERVVLAGDPPSALERPAGCAFASRCPVLAGLDEARGRRCRTQVPPLVDPEAPARRSAAPPTRPEHRHACFYPDEPRATVPAPAPAPPERTPR